MKSEEFAKKRGQGLIEAEVSGLQALRANMSDIFNALSAYKNEYAYRFSFLILTLITVAELLTLLSDPRPGMLLHGVTIMVLFYYLLKSEEQAMRRLIMVLFLMPLIRVISLGLG